MKVAGKTGVYLLSFSLFIFCYGACIAYNYI